VDVLRQRAAVSRGELVRLTGLSRTTVASVVGDLQTRGLVVERRDPRGVAQASRGRLVALSGVD
jgi:biotin operon repressor